MKTPSRVAGIADRTLHGALPGELAGVAHDLGHAFLLAAAGAQAGRPTPLGRVASAVVQVQPCNPTPSRRPRPHPDLDTATDLDPERDDIQARLQQWKPVITLTAAAAGGDPDAAAQLAAAAFWQAPAQEDEFGGALAGPAAALDTQLGEFGFAISGKVATKAP